MKLYKILNQIKNFLKRFPLLCIPVLVIGKVLPGYFQYKKIVRQYGADVKILRTAWHGTGDYYICGLYLREYLRQNHIENYVFLVNNTGSEAKVMKLFSVFDNHTLKISNIFSLTRFSEFMQTKVPICQSFETSEQLCFIGESLKGYHQLSLMDFYLWYGFDFPYLPKADTPCFSNDDAQIDNLFLENNCCIGKTVLLSPYSTCSIEYLPPISMWEEIADYFLKEGYTVITNCLRQDESIKGTIPLCISYTDIVPFLNKAGIFIGVRSGLCDIISSSSCKKVIIHPEQSDFWPTGSALSFVGLQSMGLDVDALEFCYSDATFNTCDVLNVIKNIIKN